MIKAAIGQAEIRQARTEPVLLPKAGAPLAIELGRLRYVVALADAGSFPHAAERMFIAQPTLSQQIRRLEGIVGAPLLQRRREGLRLTTAGHVLLDASRTVLSIVDHEVNRTRQAPGLGPQRPRGGAPPPAPGSPRGAAGSAPRRGAGRAGPGPPPPDAPRRRPALSPP